VEQVPKMEAMGPDSRMGITHDLHANVDPFMIARSNVVSFRKAMS
jgi:hypothetical protein